MQAVCSPIRNPMPRGVRVMVSLFAKSLVGPMSFAAGHSPRVPDPRYPWRVTEGPWCDTNVALCRVRKDGLDLTWVTGEVVGGRSDDPLLRTACEIALDVPPWPRGPAAGNRDPSS